MIYATDDVDHPEAVDIAEVPSDPERVKRLRAGRPGLAIAVAAPTAIAARACVEAGADLLVGDHLAEVSAATGAGLVCSDPEPAIAAGVRADGLIVEAAHTLGHEPGGGVAHGPVSGLVPTCRVERLVRAGHAVLVTPADTSPAGTGPEPDVAPLATASVCAWLGARVFRVRAQDAVATRQALDMVASIKGLRPPAVSRRGLV